MQWFSVPAMQRRVLVALFLSHCPSPVPSGTETDRHNTDGEVGREYLCLQRSGKCCGRRGRRHPCCKVVSIDDSLGTLLLLIHVKYK